MQRQQQHAERQAEVEGQLAALEQVVKGALSKEALERFGNIKAAFPEKAAQLVMILAQALESGQVRNRIEDAQLRELLRRMDTGKKDITITRK